jgi:hypothetical protein
VGASRCSWEETVRWVGEGKKVDGAGVVDMGEVELEADVEAVGCAMVGCDIALLLLSVNTSPAPSQSEPVKIGVCI